MEPTVSIIVPVYNCEQYIEKCINSIINQSFEDIEIVIINDGSKDNSESIIKRLANLDKRIKYFKQDNRGPSVARNEGIKKSKGKFLVFIDSDDTVDNLYVENLLNAIQNNDSDLVCCGYIEKSIYGVHKLNDFSNNKENLNKFSFIDKLFNGLGGTLWAKIFKREIIITNNMKMNPNIYMCEDLLFILEYCIYSNKFSVVDKNLYFYNRLNEKSITSNIDISYLDNNIKVYKEIKIYLSQLKIEKKRIDSIITKRIQVLINNIIRNEIIKFIDSKNLSKSTKNIKLLLTNEFICDYKLNFINYGKLGKLSNFLIRNNKVNIIFSQYLFIEVLRNIKNGYLKYYKKIKEFKMRNKKLKLN